MTDVSSNPFGKSNGKTRAVEPEELDIPRELAGLRREVIEGRNLAIKTENLLKTFHHELKAIALKQEGYERRHFVGHLGAYAVIGLLAAGAAILASKIIVDYSAHDAARQLAEAQEAVVRAETAEKQASALVAARDAAAANARGAYDLLRSGSRAEKEQGLERLAGLDLSALDPLSRTVLEQQSGDLRREFASEAYRDGMKLYHRSRLRDATAELERFLKLAQPLPPEWQAQDRVMAAYYLAAAYNQIGQHQAAVGHFQTYLASNPTGDVAAYGCLMLGDSWLALGKVDEARRAFELGLKLGNGQRGSVLRDRIRNLPQP